VHGGTNFGFTTGANHGGKGYEPDVTSYDYGCPISEQGLPTKEYFKYRELLQSSLSVEKLIDVPKPIPAMDIPPIEMRPLANLGRHTMPRRESDLPMSFEELGQNQGIIAYQTKLRPGSSGKLTFERLSDYAHIEIDGKNIGILDRRLGQKEIELPDGNGKDERTLTIIIEGMGHINYSAAMDTDRKGISGVMYGGVLLKDWINVKFPLDDSWVSNLSWKTEQGHMGGVNYGDSFLISRGVFQLKSTADTFLDMHQYKRGMVWVNGHNLGRFWDIGPQFRLYCPTSWLKIGKNTITVLDTDQVASDDNVLKPLHIRGFTAMR
jgi:beta-galactosidase